MSLRFRRSFKLIPGVKINLNKSSISMSLGPRGAHYTVGTTGRSSISAGIPGTGLYTFKYLTNGYKSYGKSRSKVLEKQMVTPSPSVFSSSYEKDFYKFFIYCFSGVPDVNIVKSEAKILITKHENLSFAVDLILFLFLLREITLSDLPLLLGQKIFPQRDIYFSDPLVEKYFKFIELPIPICSFASVEMIYNSNAFEFMYVELLQAYKLNSEAKLILENVNGDIIKNLSMVDVELSLGDYKGIIESSKSFTTPYDEVTASIITLKGVAYRELGQNQLALECFRRVLSKRSLDKVFLSKVRYEKALTLLASGKERSAMAEFAKVVVDDPDNELAKGYIS